MTNVAIPTVTLNDGHAMPAIGFGTYPLRGEDGIAAIVSALHNGYRLLDTAVNYENETEVGEAIRRSGISRADITVQSKIPGRDHAYDRAVASVTASLGALGLDYLDVGVIHWPNPSVGLFLEAWRAPRHTHSVVEPAWQAQRAVRGGRGRGRGSGAQRLAGAGHLALAGPARGHPAAEVGDPLAPARQRGHFRLRAH